jgi:hypothetical protein
MKFKPVTSKYVFDGEVLIKYYPEHLHIPVATWIKSVLLDAKKWKIEREIYYNEYLENDFLNDLDIHFREQFPRKHEQFLPFVFQDDERTTNILALCLQNFARPSHARKLERILSTAGSGYAVMFTGDHKNEYNTGIADLVERVPDVVVEASEDAFNIEPLVKVAWQSCYSRNPDYSKTVIKCVDALEGVIKKTYFPKDTKPTLGRYINDLAAAPEKLIYHGNSIVDPKNSLTDLAKKFIEIRGNHTSGTGREPTKEEAVFVLHYTVFFLSVHA